MGGLGGACRPALTAFLRLLLKVRFARAHAAGYTRCEVKNELRRSRPSRLPTLSAEQSTAKESVVFLRERKEQPAQASFGCEASAPMSASQADSGTFGNMGAIGIRKSLLVLSAAFIILVPSFAEEPTAQLARVNKLSPAELSAIRERALSGDAQAQLVLGLAYDGANRAFRKDVNEARHWFEMSAKQGNLDARFWLTGMDNQQEKDASVIRSKYMDLAKAGHTGGMNAYALLCEEGAGGAKDLAAAMFWWKKAAEAGSAEGAFNVGMMYLEGEGVPANDQEGVDWLRRAAKEGSISAASRLGAMALMEKGHLKPGPESTQWLRTAAEAGDRASMLNLGMVLFHGMGAPTDFVEAYMWFTLAAQRGLMDDRGGPASKDDGRAGGRWGETECRMER